MNKIEKVDTLKDAILASCLYDKLKKEKDTIKREIKEFSKRVEIGRLLKEESGSITDAVLSKNVKMGVFVDERYKNPFLKLKIEGFGNRIGALDIREKRYKRINTPSVSKTFLVDKLYEKGGYKKSELKKMSLSELVKEASRFDKDFIFFADKVKSTEKEEIRVAKIDMKPKEMLKNVSGDFFLQTILVGIIQMEEKFLRMEEEIRESIAKGLVEGVYPKYIELGNRYDLFLKELAFLDEKKDKIFNAILEEEEMRKVFSDIITIKVRNRESISKEDIVEFLSKYGKSEFIKFPEESVTEIETLSISNFTSNEILQNEGSYFHFMRNRYMYALEKKFEEEVESEDEFIEDTAVIKEEFNALKKAIRLEENVIGEDFYDEYRPKI